MRAVVIRRHGGIGRLQMAQVPIPSLGLDEALVEVKACSLNHLDIWTRRGLPGIAIPMPHVLGCDVAGVLRALGRPSAGRLAALRRVGQPVVVAPGIACGRCSACRAGRESLCGEYRILGFQVDGGYAEFVRVPARNLIPISTDRWSYAEWAAAPLVFLTAWHMLITRGRLQEGEKVLIHAAGSGIGSAAIQIAKWRRAVVLTTVGGPGKVAKARRLGADHVVNYKKQDFAREVLRITRGRGVDLVFEHIGPATWAGSLKALAKGGRLVTCGATSGREVSMDLRPFFARELSVAGCYMGSRRELDAVLSWVAKGVFKPVVDTVFPLARTRAAHRRMESRKHFGKLVLAP